MEENAQICSKQCLSKPKPTYFMSNFNNRLNMKRLVFTALVILTAFGAHAQFEQGTMMVGGNFNVRFNGDKVKSGSTTTTIDHYTSISIGPQFGYFIIDNLAAGAGLTINSYSVTYENSNDKSSGSSVVFSPFVRYYLSQGIFFQGRLDAGSQKDKDRVGNTTTTVSHGLSGWALGAGYAWFITDNVALEPQIGYSSMAQKNKSNDVKSIDGGVYISAGFQIYLRK
jgi:opacity protein-like surface antigen